MKSRATLLILIACLSLPAHADWSDSLQALTVTVKVKMNEWIGYWNGQPTAPAPVAVNPARPKPAAAVVVPAPTDAPAAPAATEPKAPAAEPPRSQVRSESSEQLRKLQQRVRTQELTKVAQPARPGTSVLAKGVNGVPLVDFAELRLTKKIPKLDLGTEAVISRDEFKIDDVQFGLTKPEDLKPLAGPAPVGDGEVKGLLAGVQPAYGIKTLQGNLRTVGQPTNQAAVEKITYTIKDVSDAKASPYRPLDEELLKMVAALILFDRGDHCHMVMGLFHNLAKADKTKMEATYHLGVCATSLKMHQAGFDTLAKVVTAEDKEFGAPALEAMVKNLPLIYEEDFYRLLKNVKSYKNLVGEKVQDVVAYRVAKGAFKARDFKTAATFAARVNQGTEYFDDARFLAAMNSYAQKDKAAARAGLEQLSADLEKKAAPDKNLKALTAVNLARMNFAEKKYDRALAEYMRVPKDHPLWVQALIEQGWAQVATEDFAGAIGNMYSLHSPYFKAVYQPESFAVRTIGYLNICQYGDAYRTLTALEREYRDFNQKTAQYLSTRGEPAQIYSSVKTYIKGKSTDAVDGVPYQVWREMARRKDFLNLQVALNDKGDEVRRYDGVNEKIKTEKASIRAHAEGSKKHFDEWRTKLTAIRQDKQLERNRHDWELGLKRERDNVIGYRFQLTVLEQSREGYLEYRGQAQGKLNDETNGLQTKAGGALLTHAKAMNEDMSRVLENNEFLRYEVFSGSGENIRYEVAGGKLGNANRVPASIKPTKMMNWNFDGEFWEDEIGSYRSSLQNNCPTTNPSAQAKLNVEHEE